MGGPLNWSWVSQGRYLLSVAALVSVTEGNLPHPEFKVYGVPSILCQEGGVGDLVSSVDLGGSDRRVGAFWYKVQDALDHELTPGEKARFPRMKTRVSSAILVEALSELKMQKADIRELGLGALLEL
nr:hypothetical protein Iba_chr12dCG11920 [Ipomoea batatas]